MLTRSCFPFGDGTKDTASVGSGPGVGPGRPTSCGERRARVGMSPQRTLPGGLRRGPADLLHATYAPAVPGAMITEPAGTAV